MRPSTGSRLPAAAEVDAAPGPTGRGPAAPDAGRSRRFAPWGRVVGAAAAGGLAVFAFPPYGGWPFAVLAVAALSLLTRDVRARGGALLGLVFGLAFFVPLLSWSGTFVGPAPWLLLAVSQAAFAAGLGGGLAAVSRLPAWPVWAATLWVAEEAARSRLPFGGFPWGRLAFSQADSPLGWLAAYGGAPLVTLAVALAGTLLAAAVIPLVAPARPAADRPGGAAGPAADRPDPAAGSGTGRPDPAAGSGGAAARARPAGPNLARSRPADRGAGRVGRRAAGPALVGLLGVAAVTTAAAAAGDWQTTPARTVTVAIVQGNVPRLGLDFNAQREAVLRNHVDATLRLAADVTAGRTPRPDLVLWPENASDIDPLRDPGARALIDGAARAVGVPILVGTLADGPTRDTIRNVGIVWDPVTGPGERYVKRHPVPFGEYIPLRPIARAVSAEVDRVGRDFVGGDRPGRLTVGPATVGDLVCFEVAYDGLVRDVSGSDLLVVQTNNATFGRSAETWQQLAMGRLRAVEHGRTVLVAATSGVSAVIGPDGHVSARSDVFTADVLAGAVEVREGSTLATRLGAGPEWAAVAAALGALVAAATVTRRRRTDRSEP